MRPGAGVLEHDLDDLVDLGRRRLDRRLALGDDAVPVDEHVPHDGPVFVPGNVTREPS